MKQILLMGAGKIGEMITEMLAGSGDYHVTVADISDKALANMPKYDNVKTVNLDVTNQAALDAEMSGKFAVLSAAPYQITKFIAESAVRNDVNYFDLTEDVACTRMVKELAKDANVALIPQCGLAPGYISIVAYDIAKKFDTLQNVHLRVGALPKIPSNALKYNLTWSTDGLINEYCQPCEAVINGKLTETPPLEELENFSIDGIDYEAFNTSGGLGTLCETLEGKVQNLNYRTVRYPGHRDILKLLLLDLRLNERQDLLKDIFEYALPFTYQDVVLVYVTVTGDIDGRYVQDSYAHKVYNQEIGGKMWSAIQITTSAGICAMVDLLAEGKLPSKGFVKQEDVDFNDFITNRFGKYYA
ncbi:MAG: saccharopine dehydrogenase NADP-binding domain-containing protein [Emcibacteraceae bacterium]|nr:saccharopine dehydrogenase NADP-binding domain-containing protein [Emcibacteraceae bacterium]